MNHIKHTHFNGNRPQSFAYHKLQVFQHCCMKSFNKSYKYKQKRLSLDNMLIPYPFRNLKPCTQTNMLPQASTLSIFPYSLSNQSPLKKTKQQMIRIAYLSLPLSLLKKHHFYNIKRGNIETCLQGKVGSYSNSLMSVGQPIEISLSFSMVKPMVSYWGDLYTVNNNTAISSLLQVQL